MCGEFNYVFDGSFGNENGVRTRKLGPKRRKREIVQSDRRPEFSCDIACDYATWAMSHGKVATPCDYDMRECQFGIIAWHSRL